MGGKPNLHRGSLHAILRQAEPSPYRAEYLGEVNHPDRPEERAVPDYHVGPDPRDVRVRIERVAAGSGDRRAARD